MSFGRSWACWSETWFAAYILTRSANISVLHPIWSHSSGLVMIIDKPVPGRSAVEMRCFASLFRIFPSSVNGIGLSEACRGKSSNSPPM